MLRLQLCDQLSITRHIVHPGNGGPEFGDPGPGGREGRLLPTVGVVPLIAQDVLGNVGRVFEHVVFLVGLALLDLPNLLSDRDHGVAESVQLTLGLGLGGLDHKGAWEDKCDHEMLIMRLLNTK